VGLRRGLIGVEVATRKGVGMSPVPAPAGAVLWSEYLGALVADQAERAAFAARVTNGSAFVPAMGQKWVVVSLTQQRATAYEHMKQAFTDLISSGSREKDVSTRGVFAINRRIANETMDSSTLGYPVGHPKHYRLENVLYTQYYNGAEALHYAWWHNNFGSPMSYGCINMRLATAKWFWEWASFGTPVIVV
jgi:lipoprotein-anchoring transpeptidase ErfK/SrfK